MLTSKEKIIKYLNYKGISQDKFSRACGVSSGFLRQGKSFSIEYLKSIRDNYKDLNIDWLVYDEGNMLLNAENSYKNEASALNETADNYQKPCKNCENLEKLVAAKEETIAILKHQLGIGTKNNGNSKAS